MAGTQEEVARGFRCQGGRSAESLIKASTADGSYNLGLSSLMTICMHMAMESPLAWRWRSLYCFCMGLFVTCLYVSSAMSCLRSAKIPWSKHFEWKVGFFPALCSGVDGYLGSCFPLYREGGNYSAGLFWACRFIEFGCYSLCFRFSNLVIDWNYLNARYLGNDPQLRWFSPYRPHIVRPVELCPESELDVIDPAIDTILRLIGWRYVPIT